MSALRTAVVGVICLISTTACTPTAVPLKATTASDCYTSESCTVAGVVEISSDGHGYIGILKFADGSCINVSLPQIDNQRLAAKPPQSIEVSGSVLPFPYVKGVLEFKVNGRRVGYGRCGPYYLFVK